MDLSIAYGSDMFLAGACVALFLGTVIMLFTDSGTEVRLILAGLGLFFLIPALRIYTLYNYVVIRIGYGHYEGVLLIVLTAVALALIAAGVIIVAIDNMRRSKHRKETAKQDLSVDKK